MGIYRAKTMKGAERRVRQLEKIVARYEAIAQRLKNERKFLTMMAADGPAFSNPFDAMNTKSIRDVILARECRLKPNGSPL